LTRGVDVTMKTVKEIAFNLEVSQVTVYNHIKKLDKEIKGNIFKKKGITYIDDEGIRQLKISMGMIQAPVVKENISMENIIDDISNLVTEKVSANIKTDMEELKTQVQELQEQNKLLINLIENNQKVSLGQRIKELFKSTE
jgi:polyhydroxyalkanoate synthesis regulator phasin